MYSRRKHTLEFKLESIRLITQGGRPIVEVAKDLGISENLLYNCRQKYLADMVPSLSRLTSHFILSDPRQNGQSGFILEIRGWMECEHHTLTHGQNESSHSVTQSAMRNHLRRVSIKVKAAPQSLDLCFIRHKLPRP
ncbi:MAG: transposase [Syntrophobacteraceae bacterium]